MQTIRRIIEASGGLDKLAQKPLDIDHKPFQSLSIRHLGLGPRQLPMIRVTQLYDNGGKTCLDSEMTFEISGLFDDSWIWLPVSFRQEELSLFIECAWAEPEGYSVFDKEIAWGLTLIAEIWEEILVSRGYPGTCGAK